MFASRVTKALSWTTVPISTLVTTAWLASWTSVLTVLLAQSLPASALSPSLASPVARVRVTPPTTTVVVAWIAVEPLSDELMTTVHEPVVPTVVQVFGPTKAAVAPPELVRLAVTLGASRSA